MRWIQFHVVVSRFLSLDQRHIFDLTHHASLTTPPNPFSPRHPNSAGYIHKVVESVKAAHTISPTPICREDEPRSPEGTPQGNL